MANPPKILILNGPNLNLVGSRETEIYGSETMAEIEGAARAHAKTLSLDVDFRQSNSEGELVSWIQEAAGKYHGIIINAAAYTHTSIAIPDALKAVDVKLIEVHLSNIFRREEFRHHSNISPLAHGVICGFGGFGYVLALDAMARQLMGKSGN